MVPTEHTTLEQKAFLRGCQKFEVHASGELEVRFERFSTLRQFKVPLWQIIPNPERLRFRPRGSLIGVIIFGAIELFFLIGICVVKDVGAGGALAVPMVLFGIIFVTCLWHYFAIQVNALVFRQRNGGQIHVWYEKPDATSFRAFCDALTKRAELAWQNRPANPASGLAGVILALKELVESGTLTEAEFQKAKEKLIDSGATQK